MVSIAFILILTRLKLDLVVSAYLISFGFSHVFLLIAIFIAFAIFGLLFGAERVAEFSLDRNQLFFLLQGILTFVLQLLFSYLFFRIRRFRNGFPFLFKKYAIVLALVSTGIVLFFTTWVTRTSDTQERTLYVVGVITIGIGITIGIRRGIKMVQRRWARENNEAILQREVDKLKGALQKERAVNENLRAANHSLNHRLASMERSVAEMLKRHSRGYSAEFSDELGIALEDIRRLSREHMADVGRVKHDTVLPSTNVKTIDDMFKLFAERFAANNIHFKLTVAGSILYMTEHTIERGKLETMIGDHLQNALIAVNASEASIRSVLVTLGEAGEYYEFSVHDSGIPFEIDALVRFGTERTTTHADSGGSGVGFMKTFETMRGCKASMIIQENKGGVFTKSVTIRFDGKGQYIIQTYRSSDFPPGDRYAVVDN